MLFQWKKFQKLQIPTEINEVAENQDFEEKASLSSSM
jgi:hypothetical protein